MGMYCLNMMTIALELAREYPEYEDVASKFFEHFVLVCDAMNNIAGENIALWDEFDGFYYDVLLTPRRRRSPLKFRSALGLIPLFGVEILDSDLLNRLPGFKRRMEWFIKNRPKLAINIESKTEGEQTRWLLSLVSPARLKRILRYMLDEDEFLSPYGIRSLSKSLQRIPYFLHVADTDYFINYEPAESGTGLFGGNSNWRGPIWFPINYLIIESLQKFDHYLGDNFRVELPTGSGNLVTLMEVARDLSRRLTRIFLRGEDGRRPVHGALDKFQSHSNWRDLLLFYEYFHGDNGAGLGASHQTGWTALVAKLLQQSGE
jgi:hypothetical protein